jgi:hypothetical protein
VYAILISAFNFILGWLLRAVVLKFIIFTSMFAVLSLFIPIMVNWMLNAGVSGSALSTSMSNITPEVWYFLDYFQVGYGLPLVLSGYMTRFLIRRLPKAG